MNSSKSLQPVASPTHWLIQNQQLVEANDIEDDSQITNRFPLGHGRGAGDPHNPFAGTLILDVPQDGRHVPLERRSIPESNGESNGE